MAVSANGSSGGEKQKGQEKGKGQLSGSGGGCQISKNDHIWSSSGLIYSVPSALRYRQLMPLVIGTQLHGVCVFSYTPPERAGILRPSPFYSLLSRIDLVEALTTAAPIPLTYLFSDLSLVELQGAERAVSQASEATRDRSKREKQNKIKTRLHRASALQEHVKPRG